MTNPFLDELDGNPFLDELENKKESPLSRFFKGAKQGAKNEILKIAEAAQSMNPMIERGTAPANKMLGPVTNEDFGTAGKIGEFTGAVAADLPLNFAASASGLANLGRETVAKALGPAATKAGAFAKSAIAGLPGQVATGLATTAIIDPEQLKTGEGVAKVAALSTVGSLFDGIFGVRAFNKPTPTSGVDDFIQQVKTAPPGTAKEVRNKIDDFLTQFEKMSNSPIEPMKPKVFMPGEQRPM